MTLTISLPEETERRLVERAAEAGQTAEGFVRSLVEREFLDSTGSKKSARAFAVTGKTFDQIFAPLREEVEESGISDEELDGVLEQARNEVWHEKCASEGKPS